MAYAHLSGHYTLAEVGNWFGVSYATMSRAVKAVKSKRKVWHRGSRAWYVVIPITVYLKANTDGDEKNYSIKTTKLIYIQ